MYLKLQTLHFILKTTRFFSTMVYIYRTNSIHTTEMTPETINELIESSQRKDEKAFRTLVESHQIMVYKLAYRLLCNEEDAKDAVQETFLWVWLNLAKFDRNRAFSTWVYSIAANYCYDRLKSGKNNVQTIPLELTDDTVTDEVEQKMDYSDLGARIARLTNKLSPKQKWVFTLCDLEGLSVEETTVITGLSAAKIKSNLYLARQALRIELKKSTNHG